MKFEIKVSDNLSLKLHQEEDAEAVFKLVDLNREYLRPWLPWVDSTISADDTRKFIQECQSGFESKEKADFGVMFDGVWIGSMGFHTIKSNSGWAEIGYWLSKDYTGRGIMTSCVRVMIDYGFNELGLHRIQIQCDSDNIQSKLIPERLGFKLEGVIRENCQKNGKYSDGLIYGLLKTEWK